MTKMSYVKAKGIKVNALKDLKGLHLLQSSVML